MSAAFRIFGIFSFLVVLVFFFVFFNLNLNLFLILCYATLDNILKIINTDDFIDSPKQLPDSLLSNILSQNKFH